MRLKPVGMFGRGSPFGGTQYPISGARASFAGEYF